MRVEMMVAARAVWMADYLAGYLAETTAERKAV